MQILANGQEAVATGVVSALGPEEIIVSHHRRHGHLLARGAWSPCMKPTVFAALGRNWPPWWPRRRSMFEGAGQMGGGAANPGVCGTKP
nr:thiamine pyrophosphate-dependent enzyme [uncultured Desulfobacter sp.]